jgi:outer membrane protein assembly factor BamB
MRKETGLIQRKNLYCGKLLSLQCSLLLLLSIFAPPDLFAADWPMFMKDQSHSSYAGKAPRLPLKAKWEYTTQAPIYSSPVVSENRVFVGSYDSYLYALDASSGDLLWRFKTGGEILSTPAVYNNLVIFGSKDGMVYALNVNDGKLHWKYKTGGSVLTSPVVADGKVFIASKDLRLYALNVNDGQRVWRARFQDYKYGGFYSSPAYRGGAKEVTEIVVSGGISRGADARYFTLNALNTDYYVWYNVENSGKDPAPANKTAIEVSIHASASAGTLAAATARAIEQSEDFTASLSGAVVEIVNRATGDVVDAEDVNTNFASFKVKTQGVDGIVYLAGKNTRVYALNSENSARIWAYTTLSAIYTSPTIHNGVVYLASNDRKLYGFDVETGRPAFAKTLEDWAYSSPVVFKGVVYLVLKNGTLKGYGLNSREEKVSFKFPDEVNSTMAITRGGIAYIGCEDGSLYALKLGGGSVKVVWQYKTRGGIHASPAITDNMVYIASKDGTIYALGH